MVEIECPEEPTWKSITVRRTNETIELRFVSRKRSEGDRYNIPRAAAARCIAHLLLAAAEHPTDGKGSGEMPSITRRTKTEQVELRLWGSPPVPLALLSLATARRLAHGLMVESQ